MIRSLVLLSALMLPVPLSPGRAEGVAVAPPPGYCIEREATARAGLVLIGRCAGESGRPPAVLTATVGAPGSGIDLRDRGQELADFFRSTAGRAALSRTGDPRTVEVLEAVGVGQAFILRLSDRSRGHYGQTEGWRAIMTIGGRLVTLTATGTGAAPLTPETGKRLIRAFASAMESANRRPAARD